MINMKEFGYTLEEIDSMDIGEMYDICITKSNMYAMSEKNEEKKKVTIREATQADFDRL